MNETKLMANTICDAIKNIESQLGDFVGVDTPNLPSHVKFLNELRYSLLEGLPIKYSDSLYS